MSLLKSFDSFLPVKYNVNFPFMSKSLLFFFMKNVNIESDFFNLHTTFTIKKLIGWRIILLMLLIPSQFMKTQNVPLPVNYLSVFNEW